MKLENKTNMEKINNLFNAYNIFTTEYIKKIEKSLKSVTDEYIQLMSNCLMEKTVHQQSLNDLIIKSVKNLEQIQSTIHHFLGDNPEIIDNGIEIIKHLKKEMFGTIQLVLENCPGDKRYYKTILDGDKIYIKKDGSYVIINDDAEYELEILPSKKQYIEVVGDYIYDVYIDLIKQKALEIHEDYYQSSCSEIDKLAQDLCSNNDYDKIIKQFPLTDFDNNGNIKKMIEVAGFNDDAIDFIKDHNCQNFTLLEFVNLLKKLSVC